MISELEIEGGRGEQKRAEESKKKKKITHPSYNQNSYISHSTHLS